MKFSSALVGTFALLAIAAPAPHQKRVGVLATKAYDEYASPLHF
jgi:hypothetical protein